MSTEHSTDLRTSYGFLAFAPLLLFLVLFLGSGLAFTALGVEKPFSQVPILAALMVGIIAAFAMNPRVKLDDKVTVFAKSATDSGVLLMVLIFMFAGSFSSVSRAMGGVDSVVNMGLSYIPSHFLVPGIFIIGCLISISTGTCVGTVVAMAPIAQGIAVTSGIFPGLAMGAVLGGAMFGDNLSAISDTTIAATRGVGAEMKDKFRMNFKIALVAAIAAILAFAVAGGGTVEEIGKLEYSVIKILPYLAVLISAVAGMNVLVVLIGGTVLSGIIGLVTSSLTFASLMQAVSDGMKGMAEVAFLALFVRGIIGIVQMNGGIDWLVNQISNRIRTRKGAEYSIALLVAALAFSLLDNTVAILTAAPIAKTIGDRHGIAPKRMASLLDIFACVALCLAPHTSMIVLLSSTAGVSPFDVLRFAFYQVFLGIAAIATIQFGLLRTPEERASAKAAKAAGTPHARS